MTIDTGCICHGNWRAIVKECEHLIGRQFINTHDASTGVTYTFFGVVHGGHDYYYGMYSVAGGLQLLSCVGSLDTWGYKLA